MFEINPKWGITVEKYDEIMDQVKYGEKTEEECKTELNEFCKQFREEVVKNHKDFDPYLYEHRDEIEKEKLQAIMERKEASRRARSENANKTVSTPTITCPYCKSTNTKKLSAASRGLSFGIFGFGSKKIGKQWHCNGCGSDF
jgi:polyhydroxyalkanoate synthesis regulator phasin